jgi:CO dehydrogenase maturation factor
MIEKWRTTMKIAVSGKGGVGKTTISANLAKLFAQQGYTVYAVDADPDSSLGLALGINENELDKIKPVIDMREFIGDQIGDGAFYTLNPLVNKIPEQFSINLNNNAPQKSQDGTCQTKMGSIRFLRMGGIKKGGSDCYCRENTFLKALVNSLILDTNDVVILDMGAGIEHLTRGTSRGVDLMLIVTEPGKSSIQTARIVESLARDLEVKEIKFIANKIRTQRELSFINENFKENELLGVINFDEAVSEKALGIGVNPCALDNKELEDVLGKVVGN